MAYQGSNQIKEEISTKYSPIITKSAVMQNNTSAVLTFPIPNGGTKILAFIPLSCRAQDFWYLNQKIHNVGIENSGSPSVNVQIYQYNNTTATISVQGIIIYE